MIMRLVRKPLIGIGEIAVEPAQSGFSPTAPAGIDIRRWLSGRAACTPNKGYWRDGLYPFPRSTRRFFFSSWRQVPWASPSLLYRPFLWQLQRQPPALSMPASTRTNAPRTSQNRPGEPSRPSVHPAGRQSKCLLHPTQTRAPARWFRWAQVPECPRPPTPPVRQTCAPKPAPAFRASQPLCCRTRPLGPVRCRPM